MLFGLSVAADTMGDFVRTAVDYRALSKLPFSRVKVELLFVKVGSYWLLPWRCLRSLKEADPAICVSY